MALGKIYESDPNFAAKGIREEFFKGWIQDMLD